MGGVQPAPASGAGALSVGSAGVGAAVAAGATAGVDAAVTARDRKEPVPREGIVLGST